MTVYSHEEFMEKIGKKALEKKGFTVENNLIVYPDREKKKEAAAGDPQVPAVVPLTAKEKLKKILEDAKEKLKKL